MKKVLLALVLVLACAASASAWSDKIPGKPKQSEVKPFSKHQWKSEKTRRRFERREVEEEHNDPYWDPCDYTTGWGPPRLRRRQLDWIICERVSQSNFILASSGYRSARRPAETRQLRP
jgi:hypothetical protein